MVKRMRLSTLCIQKHIWLHCRPKETIYCFVSVCKHWDLIKNFQLFFSLPKIECNGPDTKFICWVLRCGNRFLKWSKTLDKKVLPKTLVVICDKKSFIHFFQKYVTWEFAEQGKSRWLYFIRVHRSNYDQQMLVNRKNATNIDKTKIFVFFGPNYMSCTTREIRSIGNKKQDKNQDACKRG